MGTLSFAAKPVLTGNLVTLRPVRPADAAGLLAIEVYAFNPRARHVYEKAGFIHEGTKRDALHWDGQWIDCHLMALLATDPKRRDDVPLKAPVSSGAPAVTAEIYATVTHSTATPLSSSGPRPAGLGCRFWSEPARGHLAGGGR